MATALAVGGVLGVGLGAVGPAGAAGDSGLSQHIIANPVPGWTAETPDSLSRFVSYVNGLELSTISPAGGTAVTAAEGWHSPTDQSQYLLVALVALTFRGQSGASVDTRAAAATISALASLCAGATNQASVQTSTVTSVPNSHEVTCTLPGAQPSPDAIGWSRANAVALAATVQGALTAPQLAVIALSQYNVMPTEGFAITAGQTTNWLRIVGLVVAVLAARLPVLVCVAPGSFERTGRWGR